MDKRTAAPLSGRAAPQGVDGSDETDKGTCPEKEYRKLTELVRQYRKSEDVITQVSCLLSASYLFPTPEKTAETARSELMEALKDTYFMEKNGSRLMDIRPEEAVPVHRMLAMYTFMQDVYSKENPESKQERPSPQEVRSSVRILDFHRKESDMWELCNLAVHLMPPSRYVALRYGLADDYDRLDRLNRSGPESAYDEGVILESRLCRNAEKAAESIKDVRLPDFYLERLDGELEIWDGLRPHRMWFTTSCKSVLTFSPSTA